MTPIRLWILASSSLTLVLFMLIKGSSILKVINQLYNQCQTFILKYDISSDPCQDCTAYCVYVSGIDSLLHHLSAIDYAEIFTIITSARWRCKNIVLGQPPPRGVLARWNSKTDGWLCRASKMSKINSRKSYGSWCWTVTSSLFKIQGGGDSESTAKAIR